MFGRKTKFSGKKTKWEKHRIARLFSRAQQLTEKGERKKPLVEPLTIASEKVREYALKKKEMVFYDGEKRIVLPLDLNAKRLVGVYRIPDGGIITVRFIEGGGQIYVFKLDSKKNSEEGIYSFFEVGSDLGHMDLDWRLRGHGLGIKAASIAERRVRARGGGKHSFESLGQFVRIFEKLGYEEKGAGLQPTYKRTSRMEKSGKFQPKDDLNKFYRIEAIDPKNGKARLFYFPIK